MTPASAGNRDRIVGWFRIEFVRFGAVGASSTLLYLAIYTAAVLISVPFGLAAVVAFAVSGGYGYLMHDRWTFRTNAPSRGGLTRWLILQGSVLALNLLALWALVHQAGFDRLVAQVVLLPLIPCATYLLSRRRVFATA
jgi:putative flippase GtrA